MFVQAQFIIDQLRAQSVVKPEITYDPIVKALAAGDIASAVRIGGADGIMATLVGQHAGLTAEEFAAEAANWLRSAIHPDFGVPFRHLVYQPMLELIAALRQNGFRVFVVTGGGVEFVRAVSDELYGVSPDDVIGTAVEVEFARVDGTVQLIRQARFRASPNEGAPKAVAIQAHIGQRPVVAAGNSAGDSEMLEFAQSPGRSSLCLVIDHDDADREYEYVGTAFTDPGAQPVVETAQRLGWTVVSMRNDWSRIFPDGVVSVER